MSPFEALHAAICKAVALLNVAPIGPLSEVRQAHTVLRQALVDYADADTPASQQAASEPAMPRKAIATLLRDAMAQAVANGATSVSMPDELVQIAAWLAAAPSSVPVEPVAPRGYVKADHAYCVQRLYADLCDLWSEANAVDTRIGRPEELRRKVTAIRDALGKAANGYLPLDSPLGYERCTTGQR